MAKRTMLVHLNRPIRGDDEFRRLAEALPISCFHSITGSPNIALGVEVEASTRDRAERMAYELVAGVVDPAEIDRVTGDDDGMQDRQVMFWALATRQHLRHWETWLAEDVRISLSNESVPGRLIWSIQLAHHMTLVAGHHLSRALDFAEGRFPAMPQSMAREIEILRNLHEHWDEQMPAFYNANQPGPLHRSGKDFAELHPGHSPFSALSWNSDLGPRLGPGLTGQALHDYLDRLRASALELAPALAQFESPLEPSPWLGPSAGKDRWWPRPVPDDGAVS